MDNKALFKISYGLYVLTTNYENKDNGCIINTVLQLTSDPLRISVTVNKGNYTHDLIKDSCVFNISCLTTETPMSVFEHFGFQSGRNVNKFENSQEEQRAVNNVIYIPKYSNAFIACHVVKSIDFGTHTMFIAEVQDAQVLSDKPSLTYDYYQQNIKPKPQPKAENAAKELRRWQCQVCGHIYEGYELPDDFVCPVCKHGREVFVEIFE